MSAAHGDIWLLLERDEESVASRRRGWEPVFRILDWNESRNQCDRERPGFLALREAKAARSGLLAQSVAQHIEVPLKKGFLFCVASKLWTAVMSVTLDILLVEDNEGDVELSERALEGGQGTL